VDPTTPITIDEIQEMLEQRTNKQLYELVKKLDIQFPDRSKASKAVLMKQLIDHVGPRFIPPDRMKQELEKLPSPDQLRAKITKADLDAFRTEVVALLRAIREEQQASAEDLRTRLEPVERELASIGREQSYSKVPPVETFLREVRSASIEIEKPEDFDTLLSYLRQRGIGTGEIAKITSLLANLRSVKGLVRELSWPEDLELFYKDLRAELEQVRTFPSSGISILAARNLLGKRHGISPDRFNAQLLACYRKGWLTLDISSPIGEDTIESLEFDGRRYTTIRSLRRS